MKDDETEINAMWVRASHRKKYKCTSTRGQKWHDSLKNFVCTREKGVRKEGEKQHNVRTRIKAFIKAVGATKKDGSPGDDLITARLLNEASLSFQG